MTNEDLKKLRESKDEIFDGIKAILGKIGLSHLELAGLELEPSSLKTNKNSARNNQGGNFGITQKVFTCTEGRPVLRVDPVTGNSYYICVKDEDALE